MCCRPRGGPRYQGVCPELARLKTERPPGGLFDPQRARYTATPGPEVLLVRGSGTAYMLVPPCSAFLGGCCSLPYVGNMVQPPFGVKRRSGPAPGNLGDFACPHLRRAPGRFLLIIPTRITSRQISILVTSWLIPGRAVGCGLAALLGSLNGSGARLDYESPRCWGRPDVRGRYVWPPLTLPLMPTFQEVSNPAGDSNPRVTADPRVSSAAHQQERVPKSWCDPEDPPRKESRGDVGVAGGTLKPFPPRQSRPPPGSLTPPASGGHSHSPCRRRRSRTGQQPLPRITPDAGWLVIFSPSQSPSSRQAERRRHACPASGKAFSRCEQ